MVYLLVNYISKGFLLIIYLLNNMFLKSIKYVAHTYTDGLWAFTYIYDYKVGLGVFVSKPLKT